MAFKKKTDEYDVLLCYGSKDRTKAANLADRLNRAGLKVWFDQWQASDDLIGQVDYDKGIASSRVLVTLHSANVHSAEITRFERWSLVFSDPQNKDKRFIPVRLDNAPLSPSFRQYRSLELSSNDPRELHNLIQACKRTERKEVLSEPYKTLGHQDASITSLSLISGSNRALTSSFKTITLRDFESGRIIRSIDAHTDFVAAMILIDNGSTVVTASYDGFVRLWDSNTFEKKTELEITLCSPCALEFDEDTSVILIGTLEGTLHEWNPKDGNHLTRNQAHTRRLRRILAVPGAKSYFSCGDDGRVCRWNISKQKMVYELEPHEGPVLDLSLNDDATLIACITGRTYVTLWDITAQLPHEIAIPLHGDAISAAMFIPGSHYLATASIDGVLKIWRTNDFFCTVSLESHSDAIRRIACTPDGKRVVTSCDDGSLRIWDVEDAQCEAVFHADTRQIGAYAFTEDHKYIVTASYDGHLRTIKLPTRRLRSAQSHLRYATAKVVLVGESGAGKSGLFLRLTKGAWDRTESSHGMSVARITLKRSAATVYDAQFRLDVWLWDFAGQPDYRLVHQLYMDEADLALLVFDPQSYNPFESIEYWNSAIAATAKDAAPRILVAARCDRGGTIVSRSQIDSFSVSNSISCYLETSAKEGRNCDELQEAIYRNLSLDKITKVSTSSFFLTLKDSILKMKESIEEHGSCLIRIPELKQRLDLLLADEVFQPEELRTAIKQLAGEGLVYELDFGSIVLLKTELINQYASAVIRQARAHVDEIGVIPEDDVLNGRLDLAGVDRADLHEEQIILRAIVHLLVRRGLCLREPTVEGNLLVFPSHFSRTRPARPSSPIPFVVFTFAGPVDEVYATLVVRLHYSLTVKIENFWRDAVDLRGVADGTLSITLNREGAGFGRIQVSFADPFPDELKVILLRFINDHLVSRADRVTRLRFYSCPNCSEPVDSTRALEKLIREQRKEMVCVYCMEMIPLSDALDDMMQSFATAKSVSDMADQAEKKLDNESKELVLVGHAFVTVASAGHIFRPISNSDWGIDGEIEFKDEKGRASGRRIYLQLKSGDTYIERSKRTGVESFRIRNSRHKEYWTQHEYPVMVVIRTSDGRIRWMNVTEYIQKHPDAGDSILFEGDEFTPLTVEKMRKKLYPYY